MDKTYVASRLAGDWFFRPSVTVLPSGIRYARPSFMGGSEELINYSHIASVRITHGLFFSTLSLETSGGSAPIVISGLRNSDAREIRTAIEAAQAATR